MFFVKTIICFLFTALCSYETSLQHRFNINWFNFLTFIFKNIKTMLRFVKFWISNSWYFFNNVVMISFVILFIRIVFNIVSNSEFRSCRRNLVRNINTKFLHWKAWNTWRSIIEKNCIKFSKTMTWISSKKRMFRWILTNNSLKKLNNSSLIMKISSIMKTRYFFNVLYISSFFMTHEW